MGDINVAKILFHKNIVSNLVSSVVRELPTESLHGQIRSIFTCRQMHCPAERRGQTPAVELEFGFEVLPHQPHLAEGHSVNMAFFYPLRARISMITLCMWLLFAAELEIEVVRQ